MARFISPIINSGGRVREGKGFSSEELKLAGLTPGEAKRLGVPYDSRRRSSYDDNIEILKEYVSQAKEASISLPKPKITCKYLSGRVYQGKTSSGKKMRHLSKRK
jgi:hypothetical protein